MLHLNLNHIFKARGIEKPYSFLVKSGLTPHTANYLIYNKGRVFRLDHIELLCRVLNCEPGDLLLWESEKNNPIAENHPLKKLEKKTLDFNLKETFANLPLEELERIAKSLKKE